MAPADRLEVENVALPPLSVPLPTATGFSLHGAGEQVNSKNVTVPVAVGGETVAATATAWPYVDGFGVDDRAVVVLVLPTVCVRVADELP